MAMLIYLRHKDRRQRDHGGWLVLEHGQPNRFLLDDGILDPKQVQKKLGGVVKCEISVTAGQWKSFLMRLGIPKVYEDEI